MDMIPLQSTNISAVGYDRKSGEMHVAFHSGETYSFSDVPESLYLGLCLAPSHGKFFSEYIRGAYPGEKIT